MQLAQRMGERTAWGIIAAAGAYAVAAALTGVDTFAIPLFAGMAVALLALPAQRRLYASTFVLSLALELYGTWLGNWTWSAHVPVMQLVTTNPPLVAGAFYCALDALVAVAVLAMAPRLAAQARGVRVAQEAPQP
jgi:hypothetical protein